MPTPNEYVERCNRINDSLSKHQAGGKVLSSNLLAAGDAACDVLKELLEDKAFWAHLATKKPEDDKAPDPYASTVTKYHAGVLVALGYQPPPPAQEVAQGVADLIVAKRGSEAKELEQVRTSVASLKDRLVSLTQEARTQLKKSQSSDAKAPWLSEKLKKAIHVTNQVVLTGAALVGMFYGPLFPPKPPPQPPSPPPVVIVVPRDELPPNLRQPPPGAEERGRIYFYKALPSPDDPPPGPPRQPRKT